MQVQKGFWPMASPVSGVLTVTTSTCSRLVRGDVRGDVAHL